MVVGFVSCISGLPILYAGGIGVASSVVDALARHFSEKPRPKTQVEKEFGTLDKRLDKDQDIFRDSASTTASDASDSESEEPLTPILGSEVDPFASEANAEVIEAPQREVITTWE